MLPSSLLLRQRKKKSVSGREAYARSVAVLPSSLLLSTAQKLPLVQQAKKATEEFNFDDILQQYTYYTLTTRERCQVLEEFHFDDIFVAANSGRQQHT